MTDPRSDAPPPTLEEVETIAHMLREWQRDYQREADRLSDANTLGIKSTLQRRCDLLGYLASHLPEMLTDAKLLDALVASPAQITVGVLTLREIRDKFRASKTLPVEWRCEAQRSHGVCNTLNDSEDKTCGACGNEPGAAAREGDAR